MEELEDLRKDCREEVARLDAKRAAEKAQVSEKQIPMNVYSASIMYSDARLGLYAREGCERERGTNPGAQGNIQFNGNII